MHKLHKGLALCCCLACLGNGMQLAWAEGSCQAVTHTAAETLPAPAAAAAVLVTHGVIVAARADELSVRGEGSRPAVQAQISNACIVNGRNGKSKKPQALKPGMPVSVYYAPRLTRSIPPQAQAYAVVLGGNREHIGKFFLVEQAHLSADGSGITVLDANRELLASIDKNACKEYKTIKAGDQLLLWYDVVAMSLPGRTHALKARILQQSSEQG